MNIVEAAISAPWAMLPERVEELVQIAARENMPTPEALEAYRSARADQGERLKIRDNVAILDVSGPLFKKANLFVAFSGATSYEMLRRDLQVALDDPKIDSIMLRVDSPGGEANGCDELAAAIFAARSKKPITAFVSGFACSGAYWIASAADRIVVSEQSTLGSIGVVLGITDRSKAEERAGVTRLEFVSSQSPGKRPDHGSDEGKARIQKWVDDLATVFVAAVAKHRKVDADTVVSKFGSGGVEVGANAVALGMADEVGQFEAALAAISTRGRNRRYTFGSKGGLLMSTETDEATIGANAVAAFKKRSAAISGAEGADIHPKLAAALIDNEAIETETAVALLKVAGQETSAAVAAKKPEPAPKTGGDKQNDLDKQKADANTLGAVGMPESTEKKAPAATGWGKAVAHANRGVAG